MVGEEFRDGSARRPRKKMEKAPDSLTGPDEGRRTVDILNTMDNNRFSESMYVRAILGMHRASIII